LSPTGAPLSLVKGAAYAVLSVAAIIVKRKFTKLKEEIIGVVLSHQLRQSIVIHGVHIPVPAEMKALQFQRVAVGGQN